MLYKKEFSALIVDDEEAFRNVLRSFLVREKISVHVAADGQAAENMMRTERYDLVMVDLRMPRIHGHKLIVDIFQQPDPPIVMVVTGVVEPRIARDLMRRGVADITIKPPNFEILCIKARTLLENRAEEKRRELSEANVSVAKQIGQATDALRAQLLAVEESFQETIDNLDKKRQELEASFMDSLRMLSNLMEQSGHSKGSHAGRVEDMCEYIGKAVGLDREVRRNLKFGALLHDIGQFGMPDSVRRKPPESLDEEERLLFQRYPVIGATLLSEVRGIRDVVELVENHRENFDGTGYPAGKRGAAIPMGARIIRVADGCDTVRMFTSEEPTIDDLRGHLLTYKAKWYDPTLVPHALAYLKQSVYVVPDEDTVDLPCNALSVGMVLAENVYDSEGRFLAREGARMTETFLPRLQRLLHTQKVRVRK